MSALGSPSPLFLASAAAEAAAGPIKSVRLNDDDSASLTRTFSASSAAKWTWSGWVKRCKIGANQALLSAGSYTIFGFNTLDNLRFERTSNATNIVTAQVFRDISAWYHIVLAADSAQSTASDKVKIYVNGSQVTSFSTATHGGPGTHINTNIAHSIGKYASSRYLDGYLADVYFIDGQQLEPTSFGAYDDNGVWQAAAYSGTFGTNGFHLFDFANESTVGHDSSGNSNDFTANNISTTAGAGNDILFDVPTNGSQSNTGAGGEVSGNYATLNPRANPYFSYTLSQGNLKLNALGVAQYANLPSTIAVSSGKWYCEGTLDSVANASNQVYAGLLRVDAPTSAYEYFQGNAPGSGAMFWGDGTGINRTQSYGSSYATAGTVIGIAFDADNGSCTWYINGSSQGSSTYNIVQGETYYLAFGAYWAGSWTVNFGQREFAYDAPSGYSPLCTTELPSPSVAKAAAEMDIATYTGNSSSQSVSLEHSPDIVWIKKRNGTLAHALFDTVRGATKKIGPSTTSAESTQSTMLTAFNSTGFSVGSSNDVNDNNSPYVAWAWNAGSSTVSNTSGTITSQVRANANAGISVVKYTGNGTAGATIGHGLGAKPEMMWFKRTDSTAGWYCYFETLGAGNSIQLNATNASFSTTSVFNSTEPTSTVFSVGSTSDMNASSGTFIAYCFAPIEGFSSFAKYQGRGATNQPFVFTGFPPRWILLKRTSGSGYNWYIWDLDRGRDKFLTISGNAAEGTSTFIEPYSNGFTIVNSANEYNQFGVDYLVAAFAENPFQANGGLAR